MYMLKTFLLRFMNSDLVIAMKKMLYKTNGLSNAKGNGLLGQLSEKY